MATKIENQFKSQMGFTPEPPLSDQQMLEIMGRRRKDGNEPQPQFNLESPQSPIYVILECKQTEPNAIVFMFEKMAQHKRRVISYISVIGKRSPNGTWTCARFPDKLDPTIVDDIAEQLLPEEWVDVNEVEGLGQHIHDYFDPGFRVKSRIYSQTKYLWNQSVSNGTTQGDIFHQDDEAQ